MIRGKWNDYFTPAESLFSDYIYTNIWIMYTSKVLGVSPEQSLVSDEESTKVQLLGGCAVKCGQGIEQFCNMT